MKSKRLHFSSWGRAKSLQMIHQAEAAECGLACLAMIANFHGHEIDIASMRRRFESSLKGMSLARLMEVAGALGLESRPIRAEVEQLVDAKTPCILHWNMNHFVVLHKVYKGGVEIFDPAQGSRRLTLKEVNRSFTGIVLELSPGADFSPVQDRKSVSLLRLAGRIPGLSRVVVQVLGLALAIEILVLTLPFHVQWVIDHAILSSDESLLLVMMVGFLVVISVSAALQMARAWVISWIGAVLNTEWTSNLFSHLLKLPLDFFQKRHMGDVLSRFSSVHAIQGTLTGTFIEAVLDGVMGILALVILCFYSVKMTLIVVGAVTFYVVVRWFLYQRLWRANEEQLIFWARQQSELMESVRGIQAIKLGGKQSLRRARLANFTAEANKRGLQVQRVNLGFGVLSSAVFGSQRVLLITLGAFLVMRGDFSSGMLVAFLAYADQFSQKAGGLVDKVVDLRMLRLHAERIADVALAQEERHARSIHSGRVSSPTIILRNLGFRYTQADPWVFRNLSLEFREGESVAIIGPSGFGKSTLASLIAGLLEPTEGSIEFGGVDIRTFGLENYRGLLGVVMQDDTVFAGTIADNISFFDDSASLDAVVEAAELADIHRDIATLPMGYESLVGDMGAALSGGQKQRLILARALFRKPKVLVLDEATSHLDASTERVINRKISSLSATRIIFAHRKETIESADRIVNLGEMRGLTGQAATPNT